MAEVFSNVGNLFTPQRLTQLPSFAEWNDERIEKAYRELEELLVKRQSNIEGGMNEIETQYYWVGCVFRILGFTFSVSELPPVGLDAEDFRPDFVLFNSAKDFRRAVEKRGEREFFTDCVAVARVLSWDASLEEYTSEDGTYNPAYDVDRHLRSTGLNWGILTNGTTWRLFNRETSGLMNTYYEVNLMEALKSGNLEDFKYFFAVFSPSGLAGNKTADAVVARLIG